MSSQILLATLIHLRLTQTGTVIHQDLAVSQLLLGKNLFGRLTGVSVTMDLKYVFLALRRLRHLLRLRHRVMQAPLVGFALLWFQPQTVRQKMSAI